MLIPREFRPMHNARAALVGMGAGLVTWAVMVLAVYIVWQLAGCAVQNPDGSTSPIVLSAGGQNATLAAARMGLSMIPGVGPVLSELMPYVVGALTVGTYAAKKKGEEKGWNDREHAATVQAPLPQPGAA